MPCESLIGPHYCEFVMKKKILFFYYTNEIHMNCLTFCLSFHHQEVAWYVVILTRDCIKSSNLIDTKIVNHFGDN